MGKNRERMYKRGINWWMALVLMISLGLRLYKLADYPVSLSLDEVVIAYDSYSILKTGRDQHGEWMPLAFRSIGDFKPPVLVYLMVPAIAIFGLNELGTRITIALIGSVTPIVAWWLVEELLYENKRKRLVAGLTALSLAISPWHIKFSRSTFEAILALFLMITGVWLFVRLRRLKSGWLWLSAMCLSLAAYSYHAERVVAPLLALGLLIIYRRTISWRWIATGIIVSLPLTYLMFGPQGKTRAINGFLSRDVEINRDYLSAGWDKPLVLVNFWLKRYLDYWDISYLFVNGNLLTKQNTYGVGVMHLWEMIPFIVGLWWLLVDKRARVGEYKIIIWWLLVGPLAASLSNNAQHPLRSLTWIPIPQLIVGLGMAQIWSKVGNWLWPTVGFLSLIGIVYWGDLYFRHFPRIQSEFWQYGMKETALYAWENKDKYEEIVFDPVFGSEGPFNFGIPYSYVLFYGKYDPAKFQESERRRVKTEDSVDFENFSFRSTYWPDDRKSKGKLFIASPWSIPELDVSNPNQIKKRVFFKNGSLAFLIVESIGE